jgi:NADPH2:quinone reductase
VYACGGGVKGSGGALADYMLVDADFVAPKPQSLACREAAVLPLVGITAWQALIDRARIRPGQRVLIHGATGGVSHMAIQLASWAGAKVYSTCSTDKKAQLAEELGADEVIFYRKMNVADYVNKYTDGEGFDVVFDTVGGENLQKSFEAAALNGTVVSVSTRGEQDLGLMHAKALTLHVVFMLIPLLHGIDRAHHGEILTELSQLVDKGKINPLIDDQQFSIDDVASAHNHLESGAAIGKVVLTHKAPK